MNKLIIILVGFYISRFDFKKISIKLGSWQGFQSTRKEALYTIKSWLECRVLVLPNVKKKIAHEFNLN